MLFDKTGNCYLRLKRKSRKLQNKRNRIKQNSWFNGSSFNREETFNRGDSNFLLSKDGLLALGWNDSHLVMLLNNYMDPSKLTSVVQRQKRNSKKLKLSCPAIIKKYDSHKNGVDIHDQLKTTYDNDWKSKFRYYLRAFFNLMIQLLSMSALFTKRK